MDTASELSQIEQCQGNAPELETLVEKNPKKGTRTMRFPKNPFILRILQGREFKVDYDFEPSSPLIKITDNSGNIVPFNPDKSLYTISYIREFVKKGYYPKA